MSSCSARSCAVVCSGALMPLAFLASMCSFSMSWYSARHAVLSSKSVEPAYVKFIGQLSLLSSHHQSISILYPLADVGLPIVCRCGALFLSGRLGHRWFSWDDLSPLLLDSYSRFQRCLSLIPLFWRCLGCWCAYRESSLIHPDVIVVTPYRSW